MSVWVGVNNGFSTRWELKDDSRLKKRSHLSITHLISRRIWYFVYDDGRWKTFENEMKYEKSSIHCFSHLHFILSQNLIWYKLKLIFKLLTSKIIQWTHRQKMYQKNCKHIVKNQNTGHYFHQHDTEHQNLRRCCSQAVLGSGLGAVLGAALCVDVAATGGSRIWTCLEQHLEQRFALMLQ